MGNNVDEFLKLTWTEFVKTLPKTHPAKTKKFTFHSLRSSMIIILFEKGFHEHEIQILARHKDARSTRYYIMKSGYYIQVPRKGRERKNNVRRMKESVFV